MSARSGHRAPRAAARVSWQAAFLLLAPVGCGSRTGLFFAVDEGGVPPPAVCGPSTCSGCCDEAGVCQSGQTTAACGEDGRTCAFCDPRYELCKPDPRYPDGQMCFSPCNPQSCSRGCCLADGTCIVGKADSSCGSSNELCQDCSDAGRVCRLTNGAMTCVAP